VQAVAEEGDHPPCPTYRRACQSERWQQTWETVKVAVRPLSSPLLNHLTHIVAKFERAQLYIKNVTNYDTPNMISLVPTGELVRQLLLETFLLAFLWRSMQLLGMFLSFSIV